MTTRKGLEDATSRKKRNKKKVSEITTAKEELVTKTNYKTFLEMVGRDLMKNSRAEAGQLNHLTKQPVAYYKNLRKGLFFSLPIFKAIKDEFTRRL